MTVSIPTSGSLHGARDHVADRRSRGPVGRGYRPARPVQLNVPSLVARAKAPT